MQDTLTASVPAHIRFCRAAGAAGGPTCVASSAAMPWARRGYASWCLLAFDAGVSFSYSPGVLDHVPGCSCCGEPLDGVDLDIRSSLPDAILALPAEQRASAWGNSDFQRIEGVGGFLRCLMPVHLTGGASVTYSVWLKLDDE
jgi:hypothetical protein